MEIQSVTLFIEPDYSPASAGDFISSARQAFAAPVQTTRLANSRVFSLPASLLSGPMVDGDRLKVLRRPQNA